MIAVRRVAVTRQYDKLAAKQTSCNENFVWHRIIYMNILMVGEKNFLTTMLAYPYFSFQGEFRVARAH
ncbi:MAG: hypothetical protein MUC61_02275 [Amoebophilaceae bacterium]|nr:hypothetical protein [Amoebophilaceae bacterium]